MNANCFQALDELLGGEGDTPATTSAPSFPRQLAAQTRRGLHHAPAELTCGEVIDDFEILGTLGRGAAGIVYLARQVSLDRRVALKVVPNVGSEARMMASLEHPHIVQVYSEVVDASRHARLLCMQYVPGATLAAVIARLKQLPRAQLSGAALLNVLDHLSGDSAEFDAEILRERRQLASADYAQAVCWIGARLAEALAFAHSRGVLHRDVKPANILMSRGGRPLLADFGLAFAPLSENNLYNVFGGTLAYMSPEHLEAFDPDNVTSAEIVDERSDLYSLGVVLYELLALRLPRWSDSSESSGEVSFAAMVETRRSPLAPISGGMPARQTIENALRSCLAGDPACRLARAADLASALDGCLALEQWRRDLPASKVLARAIARAPFATSIALAVLPHLLGSLFTTAYFALILFPALSAVQQEGLLWAAAVCIGATFPGVVIAAAARFLPIAQVWRRAATHEPPPVVEVDRVRGQLLRLPVEASRMSFFGWLSPLLVLPIGMHMIEADMTWQHWTHLAVAVSLSFLLATTYSFMAMEYVIVLYFLPQGWLSAARFVNAAHDELMSSQFRARYFQVAAGCVPLAASVLVLILGPEAFAIHEYAPFRILMSCLILLSMAGIPLSMKLSGAISKTVDLLPRR